jgi:hypothetical protein
MRSFFILFLNLLLLCSLETYGAQPFKLLAFENSYYRDYSLEELKNSLGANSNHLSHFSCNEENLKNIFFQAPRKNPKKDSLKIQLYQSQEVATYKKGKFLNAKGKQTTAILNNLFVKHAALALKKIEGTKEGAQLLRALEESHFPLTLAPGLNSFSPNANGIKRGGIYMSEAIVIFHRLRKADDSLPFHDIGNGGVIHWAPSEKIDSLEDDGVLRATPPEVTLAHELYHAFDSIRGLLDSRMVASPDKRLGHDHELKDGYILVENSDNNGTQVHGSNASVAEYRAVYFENLIRKSLKLKLRKSYSKTGDDEIAMLTSDKKPVLIPAPCI